MVPRWLRTDWAARALRPKQKLAHLSLHGLVPLLCSLPHICLHILRVPISDHVLWQVAHFLQHVVLSCLIWLWRLAILRVIELHWEVGETYWLCCLFWDDFCSFSSLRSFKCLHAALLWAERCHRFIIVNVKIWGVNWRFLPTWLQQIDIVSINRVFGRHYLDGCFLVRREHFHVFLHLSCLVIDRSGVMMLSEPHFFALHCFCLDCLTRFRAFPLNVRTLHKCVNFQLSKVVLLRR